MRLGLRGSIAGIIMGGILLVAAAGVVFQLLYFRHYLTRESTGQLEANAYRLARLVHYEIYNRINNLQSLKSQKAVDVMCQSRDEENFARRYASFDPHLATMEVVTRDGQVCVASDPSRHDASLVKNRGFNALKTGQDVYVSAIEGLGRDMSVEIGVRILSEQGDFHGELRVVYGLGQDVALLFDTMSRDLKACPLLVDAKSRVVFAGCNFEHLQGQVLPPAFRAGMVELPEATYLAASGYAIGYRSHMGQSLTVVMLQDTAIGLKPIYEFLFIFVVFMVVMGGFFLFLAWLSANRVVEPIDRLIRFTGAVTSTGAAPGSLPVERDDEIGKLARSFGDMLKRLASHQEKLLATEERNRRLLDSASALGEGFLVIRQDSVRQWQIMDWNTAAERILDLKADPEGLPLMTDFIAYEDHPLLYLQFATLSASLLPHVPPVTVPMRRQDGHVLTIEMSAAASDYRGEPALVIIFRDITERVLLQQQLVRAQKMETLGTMAGGFAHDFNNLLTALMGYITLVKTRVSDPGAMRYVEQLEAIAHRGADMVRNILVFSRAKPPSLKPVSIDEVLEEVLRLVKASFEEFIRISVSGGKGLKVNGDQSQLVQVFLNLVINARDAIVSKGLGDGTITVTVEKTLTRTADSSLGPGQHQPMVRVVVKDNGIGMQEATLRRMFEPLFTTKEEKGTGMGLAVSQRIVKTHGGAITVASRWGEGSSFTVLLPEDPGEVRLREASTRPGMKAVGGATVLVADDEAAIRQSLCQQLAERGHRALGAADGQEAVDLFSRHRVDAVVLDLTMPRMDGIQALRCIREADDQVIVVIMSGNVDPDSADPDLKLADRIVTKPFGLIAFVNAIEEMLLRRDRRPTP